MLNYQRVIYIPNIDPGHPGHPKATALRRLSPPLAAEFSWALASARVEVPDQKTAGGDEKNDMEMVVSLKKIWGLTIRNAG